MLDIMHVAAQGDDAKAIKKLLFCNNHNKIVVVVVNVILLPVFTIG